jgi:integrase/recombinase XerD
VAQRGGKTPTVASLALCPRHGCPAPGPTVSPRSRHDQTCGAVTVRLSETCGKCPIIGGGIFVTVHGKGDKTRTVRISAKTANLVRALRGDAPPSAFVFPGRARNGSTSAVQAWRIVRAAAKRAGIEKHVSPHFLRHSHASHALERGAKVTCVRDTLGHSSIAVTDRYAHARPGESSGDVLAV